MRVLSFGEVLWDIYPESRYIGGAPLNFAAHFVKCGGEAFLCTAVGHDYLAKETLQAVERLGVDTALISRSAHDTGTCIVTLNENRIPSYRLLSNTAYDDIKMPEIQNNVFDALYFGTLALRSENNMVCIQNVIRQVNFKEIFVDINIRRPYISKQVLMFSMQHATILKISDEELSDVCRLCDMENLSPPQAPEKLCSHFPNLKTVIVTMGEKGALAWERASSEMTVCAARKVQLVSTVGAGDSFSAAFLFQRLSGTSVAAALEFASKISGFVVSNREAVPDYDLKQFE